MSLLLINEYVDVLCNDFHPADRISAFFQVHERMSKKVFWGAFHKFWKKSMQICIDEEEDYKILEKMFYYDNRINSGSISIKMDHRDRSLYRNMIRKSNMTIYRGWKKIDSATRTNGISWTDSYELAAQAAKKYSTLEQMNGCLPSISMMEIKPGRDLLAVYKRKNTKEILIRNASAQYLPQKLYICIDKETVNQIRPNLYPSYKTFIERHDITLKRLLREDYNAFLRHYEKICEEIFDRNSLLNHLGFSSKSRKYDEYLQKWEFMKNS